MKALVIKKTGEVAVGRESLSLHKDLGLPGWSWLACGESAEPSFEV